MPAQAGVKGKDPFFKRNVFDPADRDNVVQSHCVVTGIVPFVDLPDRAQPLRLPVDRVDQLTGAQLHLRNGSDFKRFPVITPLRYGVEEHQVVSLRDPQRRTQHLRRMVPVRKHFKIRAPLCGTDRRFAFLAERSVDLGFDCFRVELKQIIFLKIPRIHVNIVIECTVRELHDRRGFCPAACAINHKVTAHAQRPPFHSVCSSVLFRDQALNEIPVGLADR
ncbi:MAG: hypothetical protein IKD72_07160 [Clostridia bacterium]|nr:hypothetical protein [Clostridia bacterium]